MDEVDRLVKTTMEEIERLLNSKAVVGEAIAFGDTTVVPLVSFGFGFGAGGGKGGGTGTSKEAEKAQGEGSGGVTGGGGGIRPVGVIIISPSGTQVVGIKGGAASVVEKLGDTVGKLLDKKGKLDKE
jgi:uncharacterized spore protein YtfJ